MYQYKNVSSETQNLTTEGDIRPRSVEAGKEVLSSVPIENPNFEYLGDVDPPQETPEVPVDQVATPETANNEGVEN